MPITFQGIQKARNHSKRLGQRGERIATRLLKELDMAILCRNVQLGRGEIDIVARDDLTLCFVEVKTRRKRFRGRPAEAVGTEKRRQIIRCAHRYLRELGHPRLVYRFDIVEVVLPGRFRAKDIRYHPNAFTEDF